MEVKNMTKRTLAEDTEECEPQIRATEGDQQTGEKTAKGVVTKMRIVISEGQKAIFFK